MSDNLTAILLAAIVILGPTWIIFNYLAKLRGSRRINAEDAAAFEQLSRTAARMEQRVATLERILDAEIPHWRNTQPIGADDHGKI